MPSRSLLYHFRDRLAPFLAACHRQVLGLAIGEGFCDPKRAALDGTFVPSFASRHRLIVAATLQRRCRLLSLLAWTRDGLEWIADSDADEEQRDGLLLGWLLTLSLLAAVGLFAAGCGWIACPWLKVRYVLGGVGDDNWKTKARPTAAWRPTRRITSTGSVSIPRNAVCRRSVALPV